MIEIIPALMVMAITVAIINGFRDTEDNTAGWS
jgi:hypothetical protein